MDLFKVLGTIGVDNSDANSAIDETTGKAEAASKSMADSFSAGAEKIGTAIGGAGASMTKWVTGPMAAGAAGILALASKTGDYADRILDLSDITGLSTDNLQEWAHIADIAGVSQEAVAKGAEKMTKNFNRLTAETDDNAEMFGKMGLSHADWIEMDQEDKMNSVMHALADMEDETERNVIAAEMFGGSWKDLAPILGMSSDELKELGIEAHDLGAVMSNDALVSANEYRQEMERLKTEFGALFRELASDVIPILMDVFVPLIRDTIIPVIGSLVERIVMLVDWFKNLSPEMQQMVLRGAAIAFALGPILVVMGKIILVIPKLIAAFKMVGAAIAFVTSPMSLIVIGIAAVIAAMYLLVTNWEWVKEKAIQIFGSLLEWFKTLWGSLDEGFNKLRTSIMNIWYAIEDIIIGVSQAIFEGVNQHFTSMLNSIENILAAISRIISATLSYWFETFKNIIRFIVAFVTGDFGKMREIISNQMALIRETISKILAAVKDIFMNILSAIISFVMGSFERIRSIASNGMQSVLSDIKSTLSTILSVFTDIFMSLIGIVINAFVGVKNAVSSGMRGGLDAITGMLSSFRDAGGNVVGNIVDGINGAAGRVKDAVTGVLQTARDLLPFSPPKDKSSPMAGIENNGIIEQIVKGVVNGEEDMRSALKKVMDVPIEFRRSDNNTTTTDDALSYGGIQVGSGGDIIIHIDELAVREEADIRRIAQELRKLMKRDGRG